MKFTKIRLDGRANINLPFLSLRPEYPWRLKSVDGLGPPPVDIFVSEGEKYQGRKPQPRQIVVRVGLNPDFAIGQTVESMRSTIYGLLAPGASDAVFVRLFNGPTQVAFARGFVKSVEPVIFAKDPEVAITIDCLSPYLSAPSAIDVTPSTKATFTVDNIGDVTVGFYMVIRFLDSRNQVTFFTEGLDTLPKMQFDHEFLLDDRLKVSTVHGQKSVIRNRSVDKDILRALSYNSSWLQLHPGVNDFWASNVAGWEWVELSYTPKYWGV